MNFVVANVWLRCGYDREWGVDGGMSEPVDRSDGHPDAGEMQLDTSSTSAVECCCCCGKFSRHQPAHAEQIREHCGHYVGAKLEVRSSVSSYWIGKMCQVKISVYSFIHLENLYSAPSRKLLRGASSPTTVKMISFKQLVYEQRRVALW